MNVSTILSLIVGFFFLVLAVQVTSKGKSYGYLPKYNQKFQSSFGLLLSHIFSCLKHFIYFSYLSITSPGAGHDLDTFLTNNIKWRLAAENYHLNHMSFTSIKVTKINRYSLS